MISVTSAAAASSWKSHAGVPHAAGWQGLHGYWRIDRRLYRLYAQNGAVKVYAVDVGYGQLAWSLRTDERVVNMERTNIRNVTPDMLGDKIAFFSVDVSFISLKHIFPVADTICTPDAVGVCLVKPQFEAGREK